MTFDFDEAKKFLEKRAQKRNEDDEQLRLSVLKNTQKLLTDEFANSGVEVYLVGSITRPYAFRKNSDIDIVLKNFTGDRFDLWPKLEHALDRNVEIIIYENCHFQDHILTQGVRII